MKVWTPKKDTNNVRILPPTWEDPRHFGFDIYPRYDVGPDSGAYLCLEAHGKGPDPMAEERAKANAQGDDDYAKSLRPRHRVLYYIIDRDAEREGVQVWSAPYQSVDQELAKLCHDPRTGEVLRIDHPYEGFDISFDKEGEKDRTRYTGLQIARSKSEIGRDDAETDEILDFISKNPLDEILVFHDYDYIAKMFSGGFGRRDAAEKDARDKEERGGRGGGREERSGRDARDNDRGGRDNRDNDRGRNDGPTYDEVMSMGWRDLEEVVEQERLRLDASDEDKYRDPQDLAADVCRELDLAPPRGRDEDLDRMGRGRR